MSEKRDNKVPDSFLREEITLEFLQISMIFHSFMNSKGKRLKHCSSLRPCMRKIGVKKGALC